MQSPYSKQSNSALSGGNAASDSMNNAHSNRVRIHQNINNNQIQATIPSNGRHFNARKYTDRSHINKSHIGNKSNILNAGELNTLNQSKSMKSHM